MTNVLLVSLDLHYLSMWATLIVNPLSSLRGAFLLPHNTLNACDARVSERTRTRSSTILLEVWENGELFFPTRLPYCCLFNSFLCMQHINFRRRTVRLPMRHVSRCTAWMSWPPSARISFKPTRSGGVPFLRFLQTDSLTHSCVANVARRRGRGLGDYQSQQRDWTPTAFLALLGAAAALTAIRFLRAMWFSPGFGGRSFREILIFND